MGQKTKTIIAFALPLQIILVLWAGSYPNFIENYYSNGVYPYISGFLRILLGWIPFSFGDLIYTTLVILAIRYVYKHWKRIKQKPLYFIKDIAVALSIVYFSFHLLWGLNYHRQPITWKLNIQNEYTVDELVELTQHIVEKSNQYQQQLTGDTILPVHIPYAKKEIFAKTEEAYENFAHQFPDFKYEHRSLKSSIYSVPLTFMGYGGYLNPFTNEAQVNGVTPKFRLPTVSGHEVAHQLGYSAEGATNFIGFLVTSQSNDPYFKYSAYNHALGYCLADLYQKDEAKYNQVVMTINQGVKENFNELRKFWEKYENPLEPIFKSVFNTFLKANNQKDGIKSYNAVVGYMVNYQKQHSSQL
ncbi:MAG: DUF3810 domain-containing protein [Bacteroidota bacterium]|uniref:DUF3810 domain-containing protein n=1 Tax=Flagellimonas okinawensis TaxID=3031324 RepID=A0ABT5XL29_9FLAO|nr:DUF3810 domain-containing protein [[Muricauda] okinawensis]MDF0706346.1 DUF3810 domain-containing protein [[Muricauda] okinawensis]MEC8832669.1 DUF3810 domain-containing protein [Bacteroidota bacterium]